MLMLTFGVQGCHYAVDVKQVIEVVPRIPLRPLPHAPGYLAGLFDHAGAVVPVVDLGLLLDVGPCRDRLSTRIILVGYPRAEGEPAVLGLLAEQVTDLRRVGDDQVRGQASALGDAPYLGPIVRADGELVQMLRVDRILPESLSDALFQGLLSLS